MLKMLIQFSRTVSHIFHFYLQRFVGFHWLHDARNRILDGLFRNGWWERLGLPNFQPISEKVILSGHFWFCSLFFISLYIYVSISLNEMRTSNISFILSFVFFLSGFLIMRHAGTARKSWNRNQTGLSKWWKRSKPSLSFIFEASQPFIFFSQRSGPNFSFWKTSSKHIQPFTSCLIPSSLSWRWEPDSKLPSCILVVSISNSSRFSHGCSTRKSCAKIPRNQRFLTT